VRWVSTLTEVQRPWPGHALGPLRLARGEGREAWAAAPSTRDPCAA